MSRKICKVCQEVNSGSSMICSNCHNTLLNAEIREEVRFGAGGDNTIGLGNYNSRNNIENTSASEGVTIGTWIGILIVTAIPIINIIALCIMAFGNYSETINNYGKASLILGVIGIAFAFLISACSRMY